MSGIGEWFRGLFGRGEPADELTLAMARAHHEPPTPLADGNNRFALALYERLRQRPGNLCFSPFSIRALLAMSMAGARGETAAQMADALCATGDDETPHADVGALGHQLHGGGSHDTLSVVNSLWTQEGTPLLPGFLDIVERHYRGTLQRADFRSAPDAAGAAINRWVEHETNGRIGGLITPGSMDVLTRLLLVNAVYFKATWASEFDPSATREQPFHREGGGRVPVPLMKQRAWAGHLQAREFAALDLPYRDGDLSLLVLLPNRKLSLGEFEASLSAALLDEVSTRMRKQEVDVCLPRFRTAWGAADLRSDLAALGMPLAFDAAHADFSGMNGHQPPDEEALYLSAVVHKTIIEVNERGTEAAAATAGMMLCRSALHPPPTPVFRADRPFAYAIRDRRTGALLFLGRMADPTRHG